MTISEVSKRTGYSETALHNMCKNGKIIADKIKREAMHDREMWDIHPSEITKLKERHLRRENYHRMKKTRSEVISSDDYYEYLNWNARNNSKLIKYVRLLERYNKEHGTNYSYGQASAMNLISNYDIEMEPNKVPRGW